MVPSSKFQFWLQYGSHFFVEPLAIFFLEVYESQVPTSLIDVFPPIL